MPDLHFVSWNLRGAWRGGSLALSGPQIELLRTLEPDVLAAQEVTPHAYERIASSGLFAASAFSHHEGSDRASGCEYGSALFVSSSVEIQATRRLSFDELCDVPDAMRDAARDLTILATASALGMRLTLGSFHVPAAQTPRWGWRSKRGVLRGITSVLAATGAGAAGIDANGPKADRPDIARNVYWYDGKPQDREEYLLHDPLRAPHRYRDTLRLHLDTDPEERERIARVRPDGPLAISHRRGGVPCRYDFVFADGLVPVQSPVYVDPAGASDHSPVAVRLTVSS